VEEGRVLRVANVKSHVNGQEAVEAGTRLSWWIGNDHADHFAGRAVSPPAKEAAEEHTLQQDKVRKAMVAMSEAFTKVLPRFAEHGKVAECRSRGCRRKGLRHILFWCSRRCRWVCVVCGTGASKRHSTAAKR
jgi:hypothetical protein